MAVKQQSKPGRPCTYPWGKWLEPGKAVTLKKGRDFYCETISLVTSARRQINNRKLNAEVIVRGLTVKITVEDASPA